jgi:hypothetical protein
MEVGEVGGIPVLQRWGIIEIGSIPKLRYFLYYYFLHLKFKKEINFRKLTFHLVLLWKLF